MSQPDCANHAQLRLLPLPVATASPASAVGECCQACQQRSDAAPAWLAAARRARLLAWVSLAWMSAEGVVGLVAGAREASIALTGWALGSVIEGLASVIVIWRFTGTRTRSPAAETRARRAVAVSFFLLAPYIAAEAIRDLLGHHTVTPGLLGMAITASSVVFMPALGLAKRHLGARLDSGATTGEGVQNLLCAAQGAVVLLGLAATAAWGWRWLDPAIAVTLAAVTVREGVTTWRGDDCC